MLGKSLSVAFISAFIAGGVVYFGTPSADLERSAALGQGENPTLSQTIDTESQGETSTVKPAELSSKDMIKGLTKSKINLEATSKHEEQEDAASQDRSQDGSQDRAEPLDTNLQDKVATLREKLARMELKTAQASAAKQENVENTLVFMTEEAGEIDQLELRDQAYYDIIIYALGHNEYGAAKSTLKLLERPDLRENVKLRIAQRYAETGDLQSAFAMVETIEAEEFKDIMRLQIISTLTESAQKTK